MAQLISRPTTPGFGAPGYGAVRAAVVESNRVTAAGPGPYGRRGVSPVKTAPAPVLVTKSLEDWFRPEALKYQALLLPRKPSWPNYQKEIDQNMGFFGFEGSLERKITREGPDEDLNFQQVAQDLLRGTRLPKDLSDIVTSDVDLLGKTLASLCPWSKVFVVKLELMGEHTCPRWHRDHYCGRGIVSYNLSGTQYVAEEDADVWELENCGNNECIIRDQSKIQQVSVGDVFFMKGKGFPTGEKGLIHRSPDVQYASPGKCLNRLLLKVDIPLP
eukprot:symbB.v1.2.009303.t1/scaffold591.1/size328851/12